MSTPYQPNPDDPRAPSQLVWDQLTPEQRTQLVADLGVDVPDELLRLQGDFFRAKSTARKTLQAFFQHHHQTICVLGEINVFYPNEPRFAPDIFIVNDRTPHPRSQWLVSQEGKGLDAVMEVYFDGNPDRVYRHNVDWYVRLGIVEYFVWDYLDASLIGYRKPKVDDAHNPAYERITPHDGRFKSEVLGLDLFLDGTHLRFVHETTILPDPDEWIEQLRKQVAELESRLAEREPRKQQSAIESPLPDQPKELREVRFERHEGSGYPLRIVYPDGSWLGVNREHKGLFSMDARGRIVQILDVEAFRAASPRQFAENYKQVFGQALTPRSQAPSIAELQPIKRTF